MTKLVEKGLSILDTVLKRLLNPETQERLFKIALTKKKRVALETAEDTYRWIQRDFVPYITKRIKFKGNKDTKEWQALLRKLERDTDKFFKYD